MAWNWAFEGGFQHFISLKSSFGAGREVTQKVFRRALYIRKILRPDFRFLKVFWRHFWVESAQLEFVKKILRFGISESQGVFRSPHRAKRGRGTGKRPVIRRARFARAANHSARFARATTKISLFFAVSTYCVLGEKTVRYTGP